MTKQMKKRTGSDQTLSKSLFSYIVYIYIPTPDFSSQATTQSVLHLPVYHDYPSYPVPPPLRQWRRNPTLSLFTSILNTRPLFMFLYGTTIRK